jgi:glutamate formiminotransferase / formiminotetrahydrofolate cyclodeaminase
MEQIVECVPNFAEGRDRDVIDAIATAIASTAGCSLLDVSSNDSAHRAVYTFVGDPRAVVAGALAAARMARGRIDMRQHHGVHPRLGALDVCPFIPIAGVTLDECVALARDFGRQLGAQLGVPVYLYKDPASLPHRLTLRQIRAGEYEGLVARLAQAEWQPDFGPAEFVATWGATITGARTYLIAYNVNLRGTREQAQAIARGIREHTAVDGSTQGLKTVRSIGWWLAEHEVAQISMNLEDYTVTPPHVAFDACAQAARAHGLELAGSEIVGLVPRAALLGAAAHYAARDSLALTDERQSIRLAIDRLGLDSIVPFVPELRVIEYLLERHGGTKI